MELVLLCVWGGHVLLLLVPFRVVWNDRYRCDGDECIDAVSWWAAPVLLVFFPPSHSAMTLAQKMGHTEVEPIYRGHRTNNSTIAQGRIFFSSTRLECTHEISACRQVDCWHAWNIFCRFVFRVGRMCAHRASIVNGQRWQSSEKLIKSFCL
jgi:hypothetical protein